MGSRQQVLDLKVKVKVKQGREVVEKATVEADPEDPDELHEVLLDALKREDLPTSRIGEYEV